MDRKVSEIASWVNAEVVGNSDFSISGYASLESAKETDLTFISDKKYHSYLDKTKSEVVLVSQEFETSKTLLVVSNPKLAFAKILEREQRPNDIKPGIHKQAWVEEGAEVDTSATLYPFVSVRSGAKIGKNVVLYPGVYVGENALIDDETVLRANVVVYENSKIGKRVIIHAGTVIGVDGFGYIWDGEKHYKIPQVGNIVIEDDVEVGANAALDRGALDNTKIGKGTKIDNLVHMGHNCQIGPYSILCGQVGFAGRVKVGAGSILAGQVGIADGVTLAKGTKVGAQGGVIRDTEENQVVTGYPAMEFNSFMKIVAHWKKLPTLFKQFRELENEVKELKEQLRK